MLTLIRSNDGASTPPADTPPSWLIRDQAADGSPRYFVRLPFSEQAVGEPGYYGPFASEESAYEFETEVYNALFGEITAIRNLANRLHAAEVARADGEPGWMVGAETPPPAAQED